MKEMISSEVTTQGGSVKKTLFVVALAAILVVAVTGSAFAASGQDRQGAAAAASANVSSFALGLKAGQTNPVAGAGTETYMNWAVDTAGDARAVNAGSNSPHGLYTTTTVKCVVCHAVHYAAPGGAPVGSGQTADTLLRMRADQACIYCHATTGQAVNGVPVYQDANWGANEPNGHVIGTNCNECHTGPHAAGADESVAALRGFLLKSMTTSNVQGEGDTTDVYDVAAAVDARAVAQGFTSGQALGYTADDLAALNTTDARTHDVGLFCAECHFGSYAGNAPGASANVNGSSATEYAGHRVGANVVGSSSWNSDGSISSGRQDIGQIAFAPATTCSSCHDAKYAGGDTAFPHGWGGATTIGANTYYAKMWLTAADDAGVTAKSSVIDGQNGFDASASQLSDGVCLKCHVASGGTAGVGINF
jgi:hypothetical protein